MSNNRISRFRSGNYPKSSSGFAVLQEYAMTYYAIFVMSVMIFVVARIYYQQSVFWIGVIGGLGAVFLANMFAYVRMHRKVAEILFVNDNFSVISVYDIVFAGELTNFPLRFANPARMSEGIQIHYTDQIIMLKREEWEDLDVIWTWLNQQPPAPGGGGQTVTYTVVP